MPDAPPLILALPSKILTNLAPHLACRLRCHSR
jgi:hypothetical protein